MARARFRLGKSTSEIPWYVCEENYVCDGEQGHATQVGVNVVTVQTRAVLLDDPFSAYGYPDDQVSDGRRHGTARALSYSQGPYANMTVAGPFQMDVVDPTRTRSRTSRSR